MSLAGTHKIISVAFNPKVLKTFGIDSDLVADRNLLINLAIDFIEHRNEVKLSRHFTLFDKDHIIHGCPEKAKQSLQGKFKNEGELDADLKEIEKKFGSMSSGCKDSFLSELSNISSDGQKSGSNDVPEITLNTSTKPTRQGLIEEVSSSEVSITEPHYDVDTREGDSAKPRRLIVRIELPIVASVDECDLDISEVSTYMFCLFDCCLALVHLLRRLNQTRGKLHYINSNCTSITNTNSTSKMTNSNYQFHVCKQSYHRYTQCLKLTSILEQVYLISAYYCS